MALEYLGKIEGVQGTYRTLEVMKRLVKEGSVDPVIVETARRIAAEAGEDKFDQADALYRFVRDHILYINDPKGTEWLRHPRKVLEDGVGDCDEMAVLLASLYRAVRIPVAFVIAGPPGGNFRHVYLAVKVGDQWIAADPTWKPGYFGWEQKIYRNRRVVPIDDDELAGLDLRLDFHKILDFLDKAQRVAQTASQTVSTLRGRIQRTQQVWSPPPPAPKRPYRPPARKARGNSLLWLGLGAMALLFLMKK